MPLSSLHLGPADADRVVILLHGFGADARDLASLVPELALPGVRFVLPDAPAIRATLAGGMLVQAWYDIRSLEPGPDREDPEGIRASGQTLRDLVQSECDRGVPAEQIVVGGFSQGGAMALYTGLRFPQQLAGIVAMSSYLVLPETLQDEAAEQNRQTPIWMAHGTEDDVVPVQRGMAAARALHDGGWPVSMRTWPMPHAIVPGEVAELRRFLGERLGG